MKLGRFMFATALVLHVRAKEGSSAELEKKLRDMFARLPKIYEEVHPSVENCTEAGAPDLIIYGMPTVLTATSIDDDFRCSPATCFIYCSFKWLRAKFRSGPAEIFFKNKQLHFYINFLGVTPEIQSNFMSRLAKQIEVRAEPELARSKEEVVKECARKKLENYVALLADVFRGISPQ